jgi:hypothetical protein
MPIIDKTRISKTRIPPNAWRVFPIRPHTFHFSMPFKSISLVGVGHTSHSEHHRETIHERRCAERDTFLLRDSANQLESAFNTDIMNTKASRKRPRPTSWGRVVMVGVWVALWTSGSITSSNTGHGHHSVLQSSGFVAAVATKATRKTRHVHGRRKREPTFGGSSHSHDRQRRSPLPPAEPGVQSSTRKVVPLDNNEHGSGEHRWYKHCNDNDDTFDWYCSDYRDDSGEMRDERSNPTRQRRRTPKREYCHPISLAFESHLFDDTLTVLHSILLTNLCLYLPMFVCFWVDRRQRAFLLIVVVVVSILSGLFGVQFHRVADQVDISRHGPARLSVPAPRAPSSARQG